MKIAGQMFEFLNRMKDIQLQTVYGNSGYTGPSPSLMEKLSKDAKDFSIWALRLKNT